MSETPRLRAPLVTVAAGAALVALFDAFSAGSGTARRGLIAGRPPVYGRFEPGFSRLGVISLAVAVVAAAVAYAVARRERTAPWVTVGAAAALLLSFAASVAVVNGSAQAYTDPLQRTRPADYQQDVHVVRERGVRPFIRDHPKLMPEFASVHSRTHPPGPVIVMSVLQSAFPRRLVPRAVTLAILASLVVVPAWFLARHFFGERAATIAVFLLAVAPAPALFAFTSMDAVFAMLIATAGALLFIGLSPRGSGALAFAGGASVGAVTFMTYGVAIVAAGGALYGALARPPRESVKHLAIAGAGLVAALLAMRIVLGFDLAASFRASYAILADESERSYWYWIFGNLGVWFTFAGVAVAALSIRSAVTERPLYLLALIVPILALDLNHKFAGETERIGQFALPFFAAAAAGWLVRWEGDRRRPGVVAALVLATALQAILLEALYYTFW